MNKENKRVLDIKMWTDYYKEIFEERFLGIVKKIEKEFEIKLINLEKAAIREQLTYVFDVCHRGSLFKNRDIDSFLEEEIKEMLLGSMSNPSSPSTEVIYMFLMQYGINPRDYDYYRRKNWFKEEVRRRREECILC